MGELIDGKPLFPGNSEIDQLYIVQKVQGPLTPEQMEMFYRNERFAGFKFPDMSNPETLAKKYAGKINKLALSFLQGLLQMDPRERFTSQQCMKHPWFAGYNVKKAMRAYNEKTQRCTFGYIERRCISRSKSKTPSQQSIKSIEPPPHTKHKRLDKVEKAYNFDQSPIIPQPYVKV